MLGSGRASGPGRGGDAEVCGVAFMAFGVYVLAGMLFGQLLGTTRSESPADIERGSQAMALALGVLLAFSLFARPAVAWFKRGVLVRTALYYAGFLVLWFPLAMLLYPYVLEQLGEPLEPQSTVTYFVGEHGSTFGFAVVLAVSCVLAPIGEELLFRGYIQEAVGRYTPPWVAVLATSILFGLAHGPAYALPITLLGVLFGVLKERTGCLLAPAFAHVLHNTITVTITCLFPQTLDWTYS